jgi:hypothetical protein
VSVEGHALVGLTGGKLAADSKITVVDKRGAVLAIGPIPIVGRTNSREHRIHRGISDLGFHLAGGAVESALVRQDASVAVYRVIQARATVETVASGP